MDFSNYEKQNWIQVPENRSSENSEYWMSNIEGAWTFDIEHSILDISETKSGPKPNQPLQTNLRPTENTKQDKEHIILNYYLSLWNENCFSYNNVFNNYFLQWKFY